MKRSNTQFVFLFIGITLCSSAFGQSRKPWRMSDDWESIGPNKIPENPSGKSACGIGPVEFIRVYEKQPNHLLAGSLTGGLFYSNDYGDQWIPSGSDDWDYSGCPWADFYPGDPSVWFACSHITSDNGKPGSIGENGGVLRKTADDKNWEIIGDYKDFGGSEYLRIYGTRFHPENDLILFVLTSEGLFFTSNCLSKRISWQRVPGLKGWVYDLVFLEGEAYIANFFHGDWNVYQSKLKRDSKAKKIDAIYSTEKQNSLTLAVAGDELLILKDFVDLRDRVEQYSPETGSLKIIADGRRIAFGSGRTFAVSPHDPNELYVGESTRVLKLDRRSNKPTRIGGGYHPDVEFVAYDPVDSARVYLATHGGVYRSRDSGSTWEDCSDGLGIAEVMGMAVSESSPDQVIIGCFHDGSSIRMNDEWITVNGGDGLSPLAHPDSSQIIYTSNQYVGGGLFFSRDTALARNVNVHSLNNVKSAGWTMAVCLHPEDPNMLFMNYTARDGENKGNGNILRTNDPDGKRTAEPISDFKETHGLGQYKVYGLFNSKNYPDVLIAYVLDYQLDEEGKKVTVHRLFRTEDCTDPADEVKASWYELDHPRNSWIADIELDGYDRYKIYLCYLEAEKERETIFGGKKMIYSLKYSLFGKHRLKRRIDISRDLPRGMTGRYNLVYVKKGGGTLLVAMRDGVYMGSSSVLKGRSFWSEVGRGLPHCKIYGLDYNEESRQLLIGLFGRGVWKYDL